MTSRDFVYWLQGYLEIGAQGQAPSGLNAAQVECIKRHLALVFKHEIDPSMGPPSKQQALNEIHGGTPGPHGLVMRC